MFQEYILSRCWKKSKKKKTYWRERVKIKPDIYPVAQSRFHINSVHTCISIPASFLTYIFCNIYLFWDFKACRTWILLSCRLIGRVTDISIQFVFFSLLLVVVSIFMCIQWNRKNRDSLFTANTWTHHTIHFDEYLQYSQRDIFFPINNEFELPSVFFLPQQ